VRLGIILVLCTVVAALVKAHAGELGDCDLGSRSCEWRPSGCTKPEPPAVYAFDVASYNVAAEEFNSYLADVQLYTHCVAEEAKRDITDNAPEAIGDAAQAAISRANEEETPLDVLWKSCGQGEQPSYERQSTR